MNAQRIKKYILVIELSDTESKSSLFNKKGTLVSEGQQKFTPQKKTINYYEYDPLEVLYSIRSSIIKTLKHNINANQIESIGITNQSYICLAWEKESGLPLSPAISSLNAKSSNQWKLNANRELQKIIKQKTGLNFNSKPLATKIKWLNEKSLENSLYKKKNTQIGTCETWLLYNLTGKKTFATDYTNAIKTMLFNISTLNWDNELLKEFSITADSLPKLLPATSTFGHTSGFVPLPDNIPITCIISKNQACLYGSNGHNFSDNHLIFHESCTIINTGTKLIQTEDDTISTTLTINEDKRFAIEIHTPMPTPILNLFSEAHKELLSAEKNKELTDLKEDEDLTIFSVFKKNSPSICAQNSIIGITNNTKPTQILKGALESIAFQIKESFEKLSHNTGLNTKEVHASGKLCKFSFLLQFLSDILQTPVTSIEQDNYSAIGTAYLAGSCNNFYPKPLTQSKKDLKYYLPSLDPISSFALYNQWKEIKDNLTL